MMDTKLYDLTNPQKSIWLTEQFYKGSCVNNLCGTVAIDQVVDFDILKKSIYQFVKDNDSFRLRLFYGEDGEIKQKITDFEPFDIELVDLENDEELAILENKMVDIPFSILNSYLHHFKMYRLPSGKGGFVLVAHHLICDACTASLVASKTINIYTSLLKGDAITEAPTSYINYMKSENDYLTSNKFEKDKEYWNEVFETIPEIGNIPQIKQEAKNTCKAARKTFVLPKEQIEKINTFCSNNKISAFNFFMALYAIYVGKVSSLDDFILGTPILNRSTFMEKNTPGMFISTVPFRFTFTKGLSFIDFAKKIAFDSLGMFRHQKYPYQNILEDIRKKNPSQPNLYDILISYQNTKTNRNSVEVPYEVRWTFNHNLADSMQIHLFDMNDEGLLNISYDYRLDKYDENDILAIHNRVCFMMDQVLSCDSLLIENMDIVTPKEKDIILNDFNNTCDSYSFTNNIIEMIENTAKTTPNNIAIETADASITYKELILRVNKLSNYLLRYNLPQNSNIGIFTTRTIDTIVGILSILKINCTYVPIDPEYPIDRILYMIQTSQINYILSEDISLFDKIFYINTLNKIAINFLDYKNEDVVFNQKYDYNNNSNLYVIFTSGSTGRPKGVTISHKNMMNLMLFEKNKTNLLENTNNKILQFATMSFDVSYQEIYSALLFGNTLVLIDEASRKDMNKLSKYIFDKGVNTLFIPPAYLKLLVEDKHIRSLLILCVKNIITAGEALVITEGMKDLLNAGIQIHNHYGPAETHVATTFVVNKNNITTCPPIGKPISNANIHILDKALKLCPIGVIGQIAISGDCVGNGYLNNATLTNEKFIINTYNNKRMYLTGDLGYFDNFGNVHYIGRSDFQVKINGFRIELEEINQVLIKHPDVKSSVTIIHNENDKKYLVAYYVEENPTKEEDLIKYLKTALPFYMLPKKLIKVESLPINANGKIDKTKLPKFSLSNTAEDFIELSTSTELKLAEIWKKIFNVNKIGANYNFFDIGGDSLLAIKLSSIILSTFNVTISVAEIYSTPVVAELASLIDKKAKIQVNVIPHCEVKNYYHVSSAQKRIYYSLKMSGENSILYNMPGAIIFDKMPDVNKLNSSFKQLIEKHSSLRTYFEIIDGEIYQKIVPNVTFEINTQTEENKTIDEVLKDFIKPFDLTKAPLFRVSLVTVKNETLLLFDMHHIISDGLSLSVLTTELCKLYNEEKLPKSILQYSDYAEWEYKNLKENTMQQSKEYWINQFRNDIPVLNMPTDYARPATTSFEGAKIFKTISSNLTQKIESLAKKLDVSNSMLLLTCYYVLLSKYTNQEDIVVGTPVANRNKEELLDMIGMFVNTLPIKNHIEPSMTFNEFLNNIKQNMVQALSHQEYPFDTLIRNLNIPRDTSRNPLFDTLFTYQNDGLPPVKFEGINATYCIPDTKISKFDLSLEVIPTGGKFKLTFEYCTKLFNKSTIEGFADHFINILYKIVDNYKLKIADIDILSEIEKNKILYEFNNTKTDYENTLNYIDLFNIQVAKTPNKTAVIFNDCKLTYKELDEKSNQIANYLIAHGVKNNNIVGLLVNRSLEMVVAMIGILKAGAAYLPIDPTYPKSRIDYMLEDSKVSIILSQKELIKSLNLSNAVPINLTNSNIYSYSKENVDIMISPNNFAYLIYTSGSTGKPKGVVINHNNINNFICGMCKKIDFSENKVIVSITTMCFDIFVLETLLPLQKGLTIVIASEEEQTMPKKLNQLCLKYNVNIIQTTPSKFALLLADENELDYVKNLSEIILGGETFPQKLLSQIKNLSAANIYNVYGPTETTVWSSVKNLSNTNEITIGSPIANTQMYVLSPDLKPQPIGVPGELFISGDGVSVGYYNKENITSEKFIANPFINNKIIYKTGDLAKWLPSGEIEYLGRTDFQVKLHGLRIELGEIETAILKFPNINSCVVCMKTDSLDRQVLCAYIISSERISISNLKNHLSTCLPAYMVPTYILQMDKFKYTPNGKIDRKALPNPKITTENHEISLPETETEKLLLNLWEELLNMSPISIDDKFFNIGGDSILALKMQIMLLNKNINITYADIFKYDTIKALALKIDSLSASKSVATYNVEIEPSIKEVLGKNVVSNIKNLSYSKIGNVLLTGVTGFLGVNLLESLILNTNSQIYCLVRKNPSTDITNKVLNRLHIYFGNKYDKLLNNRIFLVEADLSVDNLGLSVVDQETLANKIDCVINSAAIVKHYGYYSDFEKINVTGVKNLIDFCLKYNKKLVQISTISVSGNTLTGLGINANNVENDIYFTESDLYINQSLENVYVRSKFEAEKLILKNIAQNSLNALLLRVGNITARYSDGIFQYNANENAFMNRLKAFLTLGIIPDYILSDYIEFTPADKLADCIVKSIEYSNNNISVLHLYNDNHVYINDFIRMLPHGLIRVVSADEFKNKITNYFDMQKQTDVVSFLSNDMNTDKKLIYDSKIKIKNNFSKKFLRKINFDWPTIDETYVKNLLKLLK